MSGHLLTPKGYRALLEELEYLEKVRRPEIARDLQRAREYGDLSENAEYETAKREQALVEGRIRQLRMALEDAEVLHRSQPAERADLGVRVRVRDVGTGEESEFFLLSPLEARLHPEGLSITSPVGEALWGAQVGEVVQVNTPKGQRRFQVLALKDEVAEGHP